jgi:hypothetical protein
MSGDKGTAGLWADMLGLGPLLGAINDPNFQLQIKTIVDAINNTSTATARCEAKLDRLLALMEADDERHPATIPHDNGRAGTGTIAVASGVAHDGTGGAAAPAGRDGRQGRLAG